VASVYSTDKIKAIFQKNSEIWGSACHQMNTSKVLTKKMEDKETKFLYFILCSMLHDFVLCKTLKEDKKMNLLEYLLWNNLKLGKGVT
jgi:hypothetical protein